MVRDEELNAPTSIGKGFPRTATSMKNSRKQVNRKKLFPPPPYIGVKNER